MSAGTVHEEVMKPMTPHLPIVPRDSRTFFDTAVGKFLRDGALLIGAASVVATYKTSGVVWGTALLAALVAVGVIAVRHARSVYERRLMRDSDDVQVKRKWEG